MGLSQRALTGKANAHHYLIARQAARQAWVAQLRESLAAHGDGSGILIAGVYRDHFPDSEKAILRTLARRIGTLANEARAEWRKGRLRSHTFYRFLEQYPPVNGCRY